MADNAPPTMQDVFLAFTNDAPEMDARQFAKCAKDSGWLNARLKSPDTDLVFTKVKPPGLRKINLPTFELATDMLAERRGCSPDKLLALAVKAGGPKFHVAVVPGQRSAAGPERFFYDKEQFTGTHQHGGPSAKGAGAGQGGYADLGQLISRDHVQDDAVHRKLGVNGMSRDAAERMLTGEEPDVAKRDRAATGSSHGSPAHRSPGGSSPFVPPSRNSGKLQRTPLSAKKYITESGSPPRPYARQVAGRGDAQTAASRPAPAGAAPRGPERFFYDKNSYTGAHQAGDNAGRPVSGRAAPGPRSPTMSAPVTATRTRRDRPAADGAPRGPERFFYDKASYTGAHKAGGPSTKGDNVGYGDLSGLIDRDHTQNDALHRNKGLR